MVLVTHQNPTEVLQPREQPLDLPPPLVPAQAAPVLRPRLLPIRLVRRNQLHLLLPKLFIKRVGVISLIADEALRRGVGEPLDESFLTSRTSCGEAFSV
jgi:hypothetical protein